MKILFHRQIQCTLYILTFVMVNIFMLFISPQFFYLVSLQHSSCKLIFSIRSENSVDPDQKLADTDQQCFQKRINLYRFSRTNINQAMA